MKEWVCKPYVLYVEIILYFIIDRNILGPPLVDIDEETNLNFFIFCQSSLRLILPKIKALLECV